jgi:hypothetical protein
MDSRRRTDIPIPIGMSVSVRPSSVSKVSKVSNFALKF